MGLFCYIPGRFPEKSGDLAALYSVTNIPTSYLYLLGGSQCDLSPARSTHVVPTGQGLRLQGKFPETRSMCSAVDAISEALRRVNRNCLFEIHISCIFYHTAAVLMLCRNVSK